MPSRKSSGLQCGWCVYDGFVSRPVRLTPRALCADWPRVTSTDVVGEVARKFAVNVLAAIGERSLRDIEMVTGVDHSAIAKVLAGESWPDLATIAKLEIGMNVRLWPLHVPAGAP